MIIVSMMSVLCFALGVYGLGEMRRRKTRHTEDGVPDGFSVGAMGFALFILILFRYIAPLEIFYSIAFLDIAVIVLSCYLDRKTQLKLSPK